MGGGGGGKRLFCQVHIRPLQCLEAWPFAAGDSSLPIIFCKDDVVIVFPDIPHPKLPLGKKMT
jgi:hypothetical protein